MESHLQQIYDHILNGEAKPTAAAIQQGLDLGIEPGQILNEAMVTAMAEVGRLFEEGEYYVPEMLIAARAMQSGLAVLKPHLVMANYKPVAKVAIGTVKGDLHDIGKNLVAAMLEGGGFEVIDLGADVSAERFIEAALKNNATVVALSALLTVTMPSMKTTLDAFQAAGLQGKVKIMVGGAPVTQQYADAIGADGYAESAGAAVALARRLVAA